MNCVWDILCHIFPIYNGVMLNLVNCTRINVFEVSKISHFCCWFLLLDICRLSQSLYLLPEKKIQLSLLRICHHLKLDDENQPAYVSGFTPFFRLVFLFCFIRVVLVTTHTDI